MTCLNLTKMDINTALLFFFPLEFCFSLEGGKRKIYCAWWSVSKDAIGWSDLFPFTGGGDALQCLLVK